MKKLIKLFLIAVILVSCARDKVYIVKTEKVFRYPKKVAEIEQPQLSELNQDESFNSDSNTEKKLKNLVELINYIKKLKLKIAKYEKDIDDIVKEENKK